MRVKMLLTSTYFYNLVGIAIAVLLIWLFPTNILWLILIGGSVAHFALFHKPHPASSKGRNTDRIVTEARLRLFVLRHNHVLQTWPKVSQDKAE